MKKVLFILVALIVVLSSCEKFEDEVFLEEEVISINSFTDFFVGTWELVKVWHNTYDNSSTGTYEAGHSVQCRGETQAGNRCKNKTLNKNHYCYLHQDQRPIVELTFSTREESLEYLKSIESPLFDFKIERVNDSTHTCIQKVCYENNWSENKIPFYALMLIDSGILQFGGTRLENRHTPLYKSFDLWIDELFSQHDYDVEHSYYGYGYKRVVLDCGGYKLFYDKVK